MVQPGHVVLLGDSIFDNGAYTRGEPDVVTHLGRVLPKGWRATSCAVDGATTAGLAAQIARVPADASHVLVAIGGNDALQNIDLLTLPVTSSAQALEQCAERVDGFERAYRGAIARVLALGRHTTLCTIYNGALDPGQAPAARTALTLFNDVVLRTAIERRVDAIELRSICVDPADYANPIEPSGQGGLKIAAAIARAVGATEHAAAPARVWGSC